MPRKHTSKASTRTPAQTLRIIGGQWRSRKVPFPIIEGLRPTPDRVRETLFNWLQGVTEGARCLDLFAGSGALGLEALSRGAESVTFIDSSPQVVRQLRDNLQELKSARNEVVAAPALEWLQARQTDLEPRYDLVFLDPPFNQGLLAEVCQLLETRNLLAENAAVYLESEADWTPAGIPDNWQEHRCKNAGQVTYRLFFRQLPASP